MARVDLFLSARRRGPAALAATTLVAAVWASGCARFSPPADTSRHATQRTLDLAIDGDGYFIVQTSAGGFVFTRNGELAIAAGGELVNGDGYRLYPPVSVPQGSSSLTITPDGVVRREVPGGPSELAGQIVLARFDRPAALERDGAYYLPTEASGEPITGRPATKGLGVIRIGELED